MTIRITQVDAFTDTPFRGNPAAVCLLDLLPDDTWMQNVAREMNLSETAFLAPTEDADGWTLRWFTPTVEVDLCGHATLSSAHVLYEEGRVKPQDRIRFRTRSGLLEAARNDGWIELDFPSLPPQPVTAPDGLLAALCLDTADYVGSSRFDYLVDAGNADTVRTMQPRLAQFPPGTRGVIVTARDEVGPYDFISRFFAPGAGIDEDPVTGSAHCVLGPYWAERLQRTTLLGYQASARGGVVGVEIRGPRIKLRGQAVTILRSELVNALLPTVYKSETNL